MANTRVHYRERQRLSAADLRREQDYRLGLMGQHAIAHHLPGVVRGLRVAGAPRGGVLTAGVAVDAFGRDIVVPQALGLDFDHPADDRPRYLLLHYCEAPQQLPPGRACADVPAPRIAQRFALRLATQLDEAGDRTPPFDTARAAGSAGLAPLPVLLSGIAPGDEAFGAISAAYTGTRASAVRSPVDGSSMQCGLAGRTDFFHFLVCTPNGTDTPSRRLGVDRDGTVHVWRPLVISGRQGAATVAVGADRVLRISAPIPAGARVRVQAVLGAKFVQLSELSLLQTTMAGTTRALRAPAIKFSKAVAELSFEAGAQGRAELFDLGKSAGRKRLRVAQGGIAAVPAPAAVPPPVAAVAAAAAAAAALIDPAAAVAAPAAAAPAPAPAPPSAVAFSVPLDAVDAHLLLGASDPAPGAEPLAGAVVFQPAPDAAAPGLSDPLAREVRAVMSSRPGDIVPATELRIGGGAEDDTDTGRRFSIGATDADAGIYRPALSMDGGRRLTIHRSASKAEEGAPEPCLLKSTGTVYLPPIGPKDERVPDLMVLAYMNGLWSAGNVTSVVTIALSDPRYVAGSAQPAACDPPRFDYDVQVERTSAAAVIKRSFELVSAERGRGDLSFRSLDLVFSAQPQPLQRQSHIGYTRRERTLHLVVVMLVEIAGRARVAVSNVLSVLP